MQEVQILKKKAKEYLDSADDNVVRMVYALLEENAQANWWNAMPKEIKAKLATSLREAKKGNVMEHNTVMKQYSKWLIK